MILMQGFDIVLPLKNPVLLFSLILFIILFAPLILNKLKIPHLIGLIIAGAIIGPHGFNLMLRDSSITLYGTVGLLYIMFLAGLEIDIAEFKKNSGKSLYFGMLTFLIPMALGTFAGLYLLEFPMTTSILLASMFASHTLIAYPIVSKLGIVKNLAVNITVGGTIITDTLALLVLAAIAGMSTGSSGNDFWFQLAASVIIFGAAVMFLFPIIGRWFFKNYSDNISQYIFVLAMVFLGAFLAEVAGIEAIIGAFLAGLALNKLIPHSSPLMNRIEFVGNALFIPIFLIGVGMLINFKVFFNDFETIKVALVMISVAIISKYLAAFITQKTFKFSIDQRRVIFGLSSAQAAATLAAVLVGYNIILNKAQIDNAALWGVTLQPERLLNESVLNGTILMILVTCTIASFLAQKGAQNIALMESAEDDGISEGIETERILIPINQEETIEELINLSTAIKSKSNKRGLYALNIIDEENANGTSEKRARKILDKATSIAAGTDTFIHELLRFDLNIVNGISNVVKEHKITDMVLGLHSEKGISDNFIGNLTEGILTKCNTTTLIYKAAQPLSTIKRYIIVVPEKAEREIGFPFWLLKIWNIARNSGAKLVFYASKTTIDIIKDIILRHPVNAEFVVFTDWNDFLILARDIKLDDNLCIIMSRKDHPSYQQNMLKIPSYLNKYFQKNNYILIYPSQIGVEENQDTNFKNPAFLDSIEKIDYISKTITNLFKIK